MSLFPLLRFAVFTALGFCISVAGARADIALQEKVTRLAVAHQGPFIRVADGAIWGMDEEGALVSRDEGASWEKRTVFDGARFKSSKERALFRTREGVVLYAFLNLREMAFKWDDAKGGPQEDCRLPVYVSRSGDDGKTWAAPALLQEGWCGAVRQMIQLRTGRVLLICQQARANPGRHVTIVYYSDDLGESWVAGDTIDLGGQGNYGEKVTGLPGSTHGGAIEGTALEQENGGIRLLLRLPHGYFAQSISKDGAQWSACSPSTIEASDSPGMMARLASGRGILVWNRYVDPLRKQGRREELSIAFSTNSGTTWTAPQIIAMNRAPAGARESAYWIAYPYVFEPTPGRLWISTMQGGLRVALDEKDFLAPVGKPLEGKSVRILTLGDSITRGARPGVDPTQTFTFQLQQLLRENGTRVTAHNVGIGGERTDLALQRLEQDVISQKPQIVTVMYGTNDSWVDNGKTQSRLSEEQYAENLREIVRRLRGAGIRVALMTEPMFGEKNPLNGLGESGNVRLARYVERCRVVAQETGVPLIDHFAGWEDAQRRGKILQEWTTDGCHPNAEGHADLSQRMVAVVATVVRDLSR